MQQVFGTNKSVSKWTKSASVFVCSPFLRPGPGLFARMPLRASLSDFGGGAIGAKSGRFVWVFTRNGAFLLRKISLFGWCQTESNAETHFLLGPAPKKGAQLFFLNKGTQLCSFFQPLIDGLDWWLDCGFEPLVLVPGWETTPQPLK